MASSKKEFTHDGRLYARVDVLEHSVSEIKSVLNDFAKEVREYMRHQQSQPRAIPFKEILTTAVATLSLIGGILMFFDNRTDRALEIYKLRIDYLERSLPSNPSRSGLIADRVQ